MKPSQQIAEEMARKCADSWCVFQHDKDGLALKILSVIPLTKLIEVARVADRLVSAHTHAEQFNLSELLADKVIALRATKKVEI